MSCWTRSRRAPVASASAKSAAEIEGAAHERATAGADRADRDGGRDVRFADAGRADQQHAAVRLDEARGGEFDDLRLGHLRH